MCLRKESAEVLNKDFCFSITNLRKKKKEKEKHFLTRYNSRAGVTFSSFLVLLLIITPYPYNIFYAELLICTFNLNS